MDDRQSALEREAAFLRELVKAQNGMIERLLTERLQPQAVPVFIPMPYPVPAPCPPILPGPQWPQSPQIPIFPSYPEIICDASSDDPLARMAADFYATHDVRWADDLRSTMQ